MNELQQIQELYDRNLFLQAYSRSLPYWTPATDVARLSLEELILGARLAYRLGGIRLSRRLQRAAFARDPAHPLVRYFTSGLYRRGWHLFDELRGAEQTPDLEGADAELRAWWIANFAVAWARLRDFERAAGWIERARALAERDSYIVCCESEILRLADRWPEALAAAERAWEISPGTRYAVQCVCDSLVHLGRLEEAAERAATAAEGTESWEVASLAGWHLCALAETLEGEARRNLVQRATRLVDRLPDLAPLADRETRSYFARARLDLADLSGDHEEMARWAEQVRSPYHRRVAANLHKNPQGARVLLPFRRIQQKHMECMPTSITAALEAAAISLDADEMAAEVTYGGTHSWAAAEWLEQRGLVVRFFIVNPSVAASLIRHEFPFVLSLPSDDSGHAVAVIGMDEAAGTLLVHDPGQTRMQEYLLDEIRRDGSPLDPEGMAIVWPERAALLDSLLAGADTEVATAFQSYVKADQCNDPAARRRSVEEIAAQFPVHAGTRFLQAMLAAAEGHSGAAVAGFQQLLPEFPNSAMLRRNLLSACRSFGNLALTRQVLADVVERGILPGMQSGQDWSYPPATYLAQYADFLHLSAATRPKARALLNSVLDRQGTSGDAWHILADLLWHEHDRAGALLGYRLASCLQPNHEHYAYAYSSTLHAEGREAEGLAWLESRVREVGASLWGAAPWITWISAQQDFGHPERALAACHAGLRQHGGAPEFLVFATSFFARMGHWEESEASLRRLEDDGHSTAFCEAAVQYYSMRGELLRAIEYCEEWSRNFPHDTSAREQLLHLVAKRDGPRAAAERSRRWLAERPGHDRLEELYYWQLENTGDHWQQFLLLARRLQRNPENGWAWQQRTFGYLERYDAASDQRRVRLAPRITALLAQCERTSPGAPATLDARAFWAELRGEWSEAIARWLEAIDEAPDRFYAYRRLWDCGATLDDAGRRKLLAQIEPVFLDAPGPLGFAVHMLALIADRFGLTAAEEALARWQAARPDEPELIEAAAGLQLRFGVGRAAAERAAALLEPAVERFPYQLGLRFSLVEAHRNLAQHAAAAEALREIVRRHPGNTSACVQLAQMQHKLGDNDESYRLLDAAAAAEPRNCAIWRAREEALECCGHIDEARTVVHDALSLAPEDIAGRELAVAALFECKDEQGAVQAARDGVSLRAGGRQWLLLAQTLERAPRFAAEGEIEACLRRVVDADTSQSYPADLLSMKLAAQGRFEEAAAVMHRIIPRMADSSPARGRLAWLEYQQDRKQEGLRAMADVVAQAPWFAWGWKVLITWLNADREWELARTVLCPLQQEIRWDEDVRQQRITILTNASLAADPLDAEWNDLLRDFPENVPNHLGYYDWLHANRRCADAAAVVRAAQPLEPDNVFLQARLAEVLCEEGNKDEALAALDRVWFGSEQYPWPAEYGWKAIERAHFDAEAYQGARAALAGGRRPTLPALYWMAAHAMECEDLNKKVRQPLWRARLPGRGAREVLALLVLVDRAPWAAGEYRITLLRKLSEFGYQRLVVRYGDENPALMRTDEQTWPEVAAALVALGHTRRARNMLAGWSERPGVPMAAAVSYVACFPRHGEKNLRAIFSICRTALAQLAHDRYAKYLAHVQAQACALLGDRTAFLQTWKEQRRYFTGQLEASEWFDVKYRDLLHDIPHMAEMLEQSRTGEFQEACSALRQNRPVQVIGDIVRPIPVWAWAMVLYLLLRAIMSLFGQKDAP